MPWSIAHLELIAVQKHEAVQRLKQEIEAIPEGKSFDKLRGIATEMMYESYFLPSSLDIHNWEQEILELIAKGLEET